MHNNNDRSVKQGDKLLKMPGKFDRGPVDFKSHISEQEGEIMAIATRNVISVPPTMRILGAVETMTGWGFRRLPVIDPGSRKLRGILTSGDIVNFLGGGDKYKLVQVKHGGNFIAAINEGVRAIMTQQVTSLSDKSRIRDAIEVIVKKKIGGIPLVNEDEVPTGIVTERDVMTILSKEKSSLSVEDIMSTKLRVTAPDTPVGEVTKEMTVHKFRRLPVVSNEVLIGMITTSDVMKYLGSGKVFPQLITNHAEEFMAIPVRSLMSGSLVATSPEKNINEVAKEMLDKNLGGLPVIEDARLIGLVTEFDLVKALARSE
jgi:CBS domain-containing protein